MKIAIIMDRYSLDNYPTDTSLALAASAYQLGHKVWFVESSGVEISQAKISFYAQPLEFSQGMLETPLTKPSKINPETLDVIIMRTDPPVNNRYLYITQILSQLQTRNPNLIISNDPSALRKYNEKLLAHHFADLIPPTLISSNVAALENFHKQHKQCIIKPTNLAGGSSILRLEPTSTNLKPILELLEYTKNPIIIQKYYAQVQKQGDLRVFVINGKINSLALARYPAKREHRANMAAGGSVKAIELDKNIKQMLKKVAVFLKQQNIDLAGLDIVAGKLIEINITSPTGVAYVDHLCKIEKKKNTNTLATQIIKSICART